MSRGARSAGIALLLGCALLGCVSRSPTPGGSPGEKAAALPDGVVLVERGDFASALPLLEAQLAEARTAGDDARASNLLFYMGLSEQRLAEAASGEERAAGLRRAASRYEAMLALRSSGAGLNNLAQVYMELGEEERVSQLYEAAIEQNDGRKSFYARRYAEFLEERGHLTAAIIWAAVAVQAYPDDPAANHALMGLYLQKDRRAAARHVADQYEAARLELARSLALQALTAGGWSPKDLATLRTVTVRTLLHGSYDPPAFRTSEAGKALSESGDPELAAIVELHEDHRRSGSSPYRWWLRERDRVASGASPRETLLALVVFLGDWHESQGDRHASLAARHEQLGQGDRARKERDEAQSALKVAEAYYLHGLDLSGHWIDANAFVALVRLYFQQGRMDEIERLNLRHSRPLYEGKGDAYARGDWEGIYRFHMALGMMYAHLEVWESTSRYANGIFQLEHARKAAANYNRSPRKGGPKRFDVPPQALELLAKGYERTKGTRSADQFRLATAGELLELNDAWGASVVIAKIPPERLTPAQHARYDEVRSAIPKDLLDRASP